jgi:hypothetical protein
VFEVFLLLAGGGIAVASAWMNDWRRWSREDRLRRQDRMREDQLRREQQKLEDDLRDYEERRQFYAEFLSICDRVNNGERGKKIFVEMKRVAMTIKLIAPRKVSDAVERLFLFWAIHLPDSSPPLPVDEKRYGRLLQAFYEVAREDLGKPPLSPEEGTHRAEV